ncbi:MAG: hypothetical protein AAF772_09905 [Acidobacteriota bacterium]
MDTHSIAPQPALSEIHTGADHSTGPTAAPLTSPIGPDAAASTADAFTPPSDVFTVADAGSLFAPSTAAFDAAAAQVEAAAVAGRPNPEAIIAEFTGGLFGNRLDEDRLGAHLAQEYVLKGDADTALAVIDAVRDGSQDDVTRALVGDLSDAQLTQIARTDDGLDAIKGLRRPLLDGHTGRGDRAALARLDDAFYRNEGHFETIVDRAQLAASVYENSGAPDGWTRLSDTPDGLPAELRNLPWDQEFLGGSGIHAELYQSDTGEVVLAFEGSLEISDWINNLSQGLGLFPTQYRQAIELAQKAHDVYGDDLAITGHSLGGGLAAAAGTVVGVETTTFNAAGVHPNTLEPFGLERGDALGTVEAFHVDGDVLNELQDNALQKGLVGATGFLVPFIPNDAAVTEAVGDRFELPGVNRGLIGSNPIIRHLMPAVLDGIEAQRPGSAG